MKLYGCISFYNDGVAMLERALRSMKNNGIDYIVAVDGPWAGFPLAPDERVESHPEIVACAKEYADFYIKGRLWESQVAKRNAYVQVVPGLEYFMILDADEELMNAPSKRRIIDRDFWSIKLFRPLARTKSYFVYNRIFKKYDDLAYQRKHCAIYYCNYMNQTNLNAGLISLVRDYPFVCTEEGDEVIIHHYSEERSESRKAQRMEYASAKPRLAKEPTIKLWEYGRDIRTRADYIEFAKEKGWA